MEDFCIEVNVAEVARTVFIFAMASFADIGPAHRSEARIVQASPDGLSVHCDLHTIHAILLTVHRNRLSASAGKEKCPHLLGTGIVRARHKEIDIFNAV